MKPSDGGYLEIPNDSEAPAPAYDVKDSSLKMASNAAVLPAGSTNSRSVVVTRADTSSSFGFGFGTSVDGEKVVSVVSPSGPSAQLLNVGDVLHAVNGTSAAEASHDEIVELCLSALQLELVVELKYAEADRAMTAGSRDDNHRTVSISRLKPGSTFGFSFGTTIDGEKVISAVAKDGVAAGKLQPGDLILSVNGIDTGSADHDEIVKICSELSAVDLVVTRKYSGTARRKIVVKRKLMTDSFGFSFGTTEQGEKVVSKVSSSGAAAGLLKEGMVIHAVNDVDVTTIGHDDMIQLCRRSGQLELVTDQKYCDVSDISSRPLKSQVARIIVLERNSPNSQFGFEVSVTNEGAVVVSEVDGVAAGRLAIGDVLNSINGTSMTNIEHSEVMELFRAASRLELEVEHQNLRIPPSDTEGARKRDFHPDPFSVATSALDSVA